MSQIRDLMASEELALQAKCMKGQGDGLTGERALRVPMGALTAEEKKKKLKAEGGGVRWVSRSHGSLTSAGTSEGAERGWDTRGRGRRGRDTSGFTGYRVATLGESRPYHLIEGIGPHGGNWAAKEATGSRRGEMKVFNSRKEAEEHIRHSQD